jgi:opacity protein-like surface antigen
MQTLFRKLIAALISMLLIGKVQAQRLYIHLDGGAVNYGGDLQDKLFTLEQANSLFGGGLHYKISNIISLEANFSAGKLAANDSKNDRMSFKRRNLSFYSNIAEGSVMLHANLKDVPGNAKFTPYVSAGLAIFHYNPYAYTVTGQKAYLQPLGTEGQGLPQYPDRKTYALTQLAIPFGGGLKYAITDHFMIGAELIFRKLFTDHLDDVSSLRYADTALLRATRGGLAAIMSFRSDETDNPVDFFNANIQRGNPARNDTYYAVILKLYIGLDALFGSWSNSNFSKRMRQQSNCPPKVL